MKCFIATLGCPKNVVDSEGMGSLLEAQGHALVAQAEDADVLIVNTCSFIQDARDEALGVLRELGQHKAEHQRLIAAGCMAESHRELVQRVPGVDSLLSTRQWMHIGDMVAPAAPHPAAPDPGAQALQADWRTVPIRRSTSQPSAYIKVSDGCNLRCSFCTIPAIKGDMRSKTIAAIVAEARELVAQGVRELVLVAQHLTDYGRDLGMQEGLSELLDALCAALPAEVWVRLLYAYPQSITPRLIATMARHPQICAYLDMPLQHAHPDTLRRMHRPPDIDHTRQVIADLRSAMPDIALRSTCIVGFPGETGNEFRALLAFFQDMQFDWVGAFSYSQEPETPAARLSHQVNPRTKDRRWHRFMEMQQAVSLACGSQWVGRELEVLVEGVGEVDDGRSLLVGRSFREAPEIDGQVFVWGTAPIGAVVCARVVQATAYDLWGEVACG